MTSGDAVFRAVGTTAALPDLLPPGSTAGREAVAWLPPRATAERTAALCAAASVALQPLLHPTGPGNSSPVDVAVLLTILTTAMWAATATVRLRAPYAVAVALMVLGGALAGMTGPLPGTSLLAVFQDMVIFAWATAITNLARRPGMVRLLSTVWALTSMCWAAVLVTASLFGVTAVEGIVAREGNRALFTFGDPNYAGTYWVASVFIVYATQRPRRPWLRRLAYLLLVWSLALTESNGGVLALLLGIAVVVLVTVRHRVGAAATVATAAVIAAAVLAAVTLVPFAEIQAWARQSGQPLLVNSIGRSDNSSEQRSALIKESLQLYQTDGLLGIGPSTTKTLLIDRHYPYAKEAHDDYLAALVERGPLGVLGLLTLVVTAVVLSTRVVRGPPRGWPELPRPTGLAAALAALALAGTYYEVLHFRFVWLVLAMTAAVAARWPEVSRVATETSVGRHARAGRFR